jgi:RHS repeat-associated protein
MTKSPGAILKRRMAGSRSERGQEARVTVGRIYDPEIGKFFSADPTMQFPESTQGFNRYAYAGNNPLTDVDPSGFGFFKSLMKGLGILNAIFSIFIPPLSMLGAAINGFLTSVMITGNLKAGIIGGLTAGFMFGIGDKFIGQVGNMAKFGKAFLEGVVGGVSSALAGGKFGSGFAGAFAGSLSGSYVKLSANPAVKLIQASVIGGTVSEIGGGKFGNGAITAAFASMFNDLAHGSQYSTADAMKNIDGDASLSPDDKIARLKVLRASLTAAGTTVSKATPAGLRGLLFGGRSKR